ncbi:MAG: NADH:ubiquinone reductase (Na(+)-transporting) subunit C [Tannerella sp.]|nr:NADH:ubiquinone reductase (Na(+)-transporting) subunit C [Tannerella sp.]
MNRDSNVYTITYASVMVVLVAVLLAFASESLRSYQKKNEADDKRQQILRSVNVSVSGSETEKKYNELIKESFLVNEKGERVAGDAFAVDAAKMFTEGAYPVFVADIDGRTKYIMVMYGAGLWGPIWGYISVEEDRNTVFGTDFSHQGETPGLGAEIATLTFSSRFPGKQLFKNEEFKSIAIVKPGRTVQDQDYVDGISGGTITSNGVNQMIRNSLKSYVGFLNAKN